MIYNGQVWQSPSKLEAITQWLDGDTWILLSTPYKAAYGGTAMMPHSHRVEEFKNEWTIYFNREALEHHLITNNWVLTNLVVPYAVQQQDA